MNDHKNLIWLLGSRSTEAYLFDTDTGLEKRFRSHERVGPGAGNGSYMSSGMRRTFVCTYADSDRKTIWLQIGTVRVPLDGVTKATSEVHAGGRYSTLVIERGGKVIIELKQRTLGRLVSRYIDPFYDGLDELADDDAAAVARITNSPEARTAFLAVKDPEAGPWYLLDDEQS